MVRFWTMCEVSWQLAVYPSSTFMLFQVWTEEALDFSLQAM